MTARAAVQRPLTLKAGGDWETNQQLHEVRGPIFTSEVLGSERTQAELSRRRMSGAVPRSLRAGLGAHQALPLSSAPTLRLLCP